MTIEKPEHIELPQFPSVREAGYAEEHVDEYTKGLVTSYNRLLDALYDLRVKNQELEAENDQLKVQVSVLEDEKAALEESNRLLGDLVEQLREQIEPLQEQLSQAQDTINGLNETISFKDSENESLRHNLADYATDVERLNNEATAARDALQSVNNENEHYRNELSHAQDALTQLRAERDDTHNDKNSVDIEKAALEEELEVVKTENVTLRAAVDQLSAQALGLNTSEVVASTVYDDDQAAWESAEETPSEETTEPEYENELEAGRATLNEIRDDEELPASDRASTLVNKAYKIGEEYITNASLESERILSEANGQSAELVADAQNRAATLVAEAEAHYVALIAEAEAAAAELNRESIREAAHVENSVQALREERDFILERLRSFSYGIIERVEDIASLPEYDPELEKYLDTAVVEVTPEEPTAEEVFDNETPAYEEEPVQEETPEANDDVEEEDVATEDEFEDDVEDYRDDANSDETDDEVSDDDEDTVVVEDDYEDERYGETPDSREEGQENPNAPVSNSDWSISMPARPASAPMREVPSFTQILNAPVAEEEEEVEAEESPKKKRSFKDILSGKKE